MTGGPEPLTPERGYAKSLVMALVNQVSLKEKFTMIEFITSYWLVVLPTAFTGLFLTGVLKKMRDDKTRKQKALATIEARRKQ